MGSDAEGALGAAPARTGTSFGEPVALGYLAFTEAWERFSYYGMSALVVLYMTETLFLPGHAEHVVGLAGVRAWFEGGGRPLSAQALASMIYGTYSGLICFTPLFGGLLADRVIGARATVILGALLLCAGHLAMAFDASFLLGLLLLILGCGCVKGNVAAQAGALYPRDDDAARTRGFMLFNMGINTGAIVGPIVCGLLAQLYGWHVGFGCAAVIMVAGLVTYLAGLKHLPPEAVRGRREAPAPHLAAGDWRTIGVLTAVVALTVFQSVAYYQLGNGGMIWVRHMVDLSTPWGAVPAAWFRSVDSFTSVALAAPLIALWRRQAAKGAEPSDYAKLGYGAAIASASALLLAIGSVSAPAGHVSPLWPLGAFAGMGVAFLYYWPTIMALVSRRAPAETSGIMLGVVFLSLFVAKTTMGWVGSLYETMSPAAFWSLDAAIAAAGAVLVAVLWRPLARRV
ncbi:oligopeptide:H+ symporter [Phenylobacterium aquaticum]|uniref:peptide MFS transporter n=1 Tax=Phenylobacterium aquaticum TaxID=1763816 RepID=UPI00301500F5